MLPAGRATAIDIQRPPSLRPFWLCSLTAAVMFVASSWVLALGLPDLGPHGRGALEVIVAFLVVSGVRLGRVPFAWSAVRHWNAYRSYDAFHHGVRRERADQREQHLLERAKAAESQARRVRAVLAAGDSLAIYLQPIFDTTRQEPLGYEALARFAGGRPPDWWFAEAHAIGLGNDLEAFAAERALELVPFLPAGTYLSVNLSPSALGGSAQAVLAEADLSRLVIEITEHAVVADYEHLNTMLEPLRARGLRIAVDDMGAGYANLRHVTELRPALVKLDRSLVTNLRDGTDRAAVIESMVHLATVTGSTVVAEGVETHEELAALTKLGVTHAQGWLFARPAPPDTLFAAADPVPG